MAENTVAGKKNFWEKVDRWVTTLTAIPVFGIILKKLFEGVAEKGAEKLQKKVEKILGTLSEAKKDVTDEVLYSTVVYSMGEAEAQEVDNFEERLRRENKEKAEAFVLYIAKIVQMFERDTTETINPPKGETGPQIKQQYKKIEVGIEEAKKILTALLKKTGIDADSTFNVRIAFLEGKNVFSLIPTKKEPSKTVSAISDFAKKTTDKAKAAGEKVTQDQKANFTDLGSFAETAHTKAKQRLKDALDKRRK